MKRKNRITKTKWWHKEWDRTFSKLLGETAIYLGKGISFNDIAKQRIEEIVQRELWFLTKRHNLVAIAIERSGEKNKNGVEQVKKLIGDFEWTRDNADKYVRQLKEILQ